MQLFSTIIYKKRNITTEQDTDREKERGEENGIKLCSKVN